MARSLSKHKEVQSEVCSVVLVVSVWAPPHIHPSRQLPDLLFANCRLLLSGGGV